MIGLLFSEESASSRKSSRRKSSHLVCHDSDGDGDGGDDDTINNCSQHLCLYTDLTGGHP